MLHHNGGTRRQTLEDDLESLVYVVLYCAFLWLPHDAAQDTIASTMAMFFEFSLPWANGVPFGGIGKVSNSVFRGYTGPIQFSPALRHWIDAVLDCIWPPKPDLPLPPSGTGKKHEYMENLPGMELQEPRMDRLEVVWTSDEETTDESDEDEDPPKTSQDGVPKKMPEDDERLEPLEDGEKKPFDDEALGETSAVVELVVEVCRNTPEADLQETSELEDLAVPRTSPPMTVKQPGPVEEVEQLRVAEELLVDSQGVALTLATRLSDLWAEFLQTYPLNRDDRVVHDDPHATGEWYANAWPLSPRPYGGGVRRKRSLHDTEDGTLQDLLDSASESDSPTHERSQSSGFPAAKRIHILEAGPSSARTDSLVLVKGGRMSRAQRTQLAQPRGIWRSRKPPRNAPARK